MANKRSKHNFNEESRGYLKKHLDPSLEVNRMLRSNDGFKKCVEFLYTQLQPGWRKSASLLRMEFVKWQKHRGHVYSGSTLQRYLRWLADRKYLSIEWDGRTAWFGMFSPTKQTGERFEAFWFLVADNLFLPKREPKPKPKQNPMMLFGKKHSVGLLGRRPKPKPNSN